MTPQTKPKLPIQNWIASLFVLGIASLFGAMVIIKVAEVSFILVVGVPALLYAVAVISALARVEVGRKAAAGMTAVLGLLLIGMSVYSTLVVGKKASVGSMFFYLLLSVVFVRNFTSDEFKAYCSPRKPELDAVFE